MFSLLLAVCTYINVPVATMYEQPNANSKYVSQAIYAEDVSIVERQGDWSKIKTNNDNYEGWTQIRNLIQLSDEYPTGESARISSTKAHIYDIKDTEYGPSKDLPSLPFESRLLVTDNFGASQGRWLKVRLLNGKEAYVQRGDLNFEPKKQLDKTELVEFSKKFLGLPYTWGGRSSFGYDCSGFVQMLYRQLGITLPRDSKDQVNWEGFKEVPLEQAHPGDLIFFGSAPDKITHVTMYIGNGEIINATVRENPQIHISKLADFDWTGSGKPNPKEGWPSAYAYRTVRTLKNT
ncbi:MAG: Nlp/P60 [Chlamydiales bacterium]|jgi:cell wall-associated NlpC family hydrolase|nr:Nlp/P60 [Chlamydiales bacterium]